jgi:toxin YoeB
MNWNLVYTKQAQKDAKKLAASNLKGKAEELLEILKENPFQNPPPYEKLVGDLEECLFSTDKYPAPLGI